MSNKSDWFEWKDEDLKELGIKDFQFFDYLKEGLHPHTRYDYQPIQCPPEHHQYYHKSNRLDEISSLLKTFDGFVKEGRETKRYIDYGNPLYFNFLKLCDYQFTAYMDDSYPGRLHISLKDIENLKKERKKEYDRIVEEMNAISIDDWKYFALPPIKEDREKLKSELTEGNVFKKDIALEIKGKFEAGKGKEIASTGIDSQEAAELKREDYLKDPELLKLLKRARSEIEFLYDNIKVMKKETGFNERELVDPEGDLRKETIEAFNQQEDKFECIKEEYLKNRTIYKMSYKKEKRDFIGKLLQKIFKARYPRDVELWGDYQKLYELSKKSRKNLLPNLNY